MPTTVTIYNDTGSGTIAITRIPADKSAPTETKEAVGKEGPESQCFEIMHDDILIIRPIQ